MYFKARNLLYKFTSKIHYRRFMLRVGRIFVIIFLIWAFVFILTLRRSVRTIAMKNYNVSYTSYTKTMNYFNSEEKIINMGLYGKVNRDTLIIVIVTEGFSKELNITLYSLSRVKGIEGALVIFSHLYYDETLTAVIDRIHFCRVLQIFYPHVGQMDLRQFSVNNLNNHSAGNDKQSTQTTKKTDTYFLDKSIDRKHHWWWTANHIFESLKCTRKLTGLVIFMKDDSIFTKDFIYMTMYMKNLAGSLPRCEFVSMGTHSVSNAEYFGSDIYSAKLTVWNPKIHSSFLAFDVTTWDIMAAHYELYCGVKDTSWARSLYYISLHRIDGLKFKVLSSVTPRAYKIRKCKWFCDSNTDIDVLTKFENANEGNWFPRLVKLYIDVGTHLEINDIQGYDSEIHEPTADPRDRALCYNMTTSKIKKLIMTLRLDE